MDMYNKFIKELEKINIGKITSEMVQIQSYSFMENQEKEIAEYIYNIFQTEDIESRLIEIRPGRYNVYGKLPGSDRSGESKSIMLSGHIDTVPAYDMENAFSGTIEGDIIFGRGTCDMKGPVASMIATLIAIKRSKTPHKGDIYFTGLADEEEQGRGAEYLIKNGPAADAVIMGEPTDMKIAIGHKGLEWIEVKIKGRKVHGGNKENGINAIEMAARFVNKVYTEYVPVLNQREYPILGAPTINIGTISGGDQPSTVAGECIIKLDRRCVPTESINQVYQELEDIVAELHNEDERFLAEIKDVFDGEDLMDHVPFAIEEKDPLVESVKKAMNECSFDSVICAFPAWSDAGFISNLCDSKCIVMGPGDLGVAHSTKEYVKISDLNMAAKIYGYTVLDYSN